MAKNGKEPISHNDYGSDIDNSTGVIGELEEDSGILQPADLEFLSGLMQEADGNSKPLTMAPIKKTKKKPLKKPIEKKPIEEHAKRSIEESVEALIEEPVGSSVDIALDELIGLSDDEDPEDALVVPPMGATVVANVNITPGGQLSNIIANPLENDNLVAVIRDNKPTGTIMRAIMEEIAEEAAYIKAWRVDKWNTGEDLSDATFKRIKMLKHLVETIIEQEKLKKESVSGKVDFHGEAFKRVLKYFLETIQKTFRKVHIPVQFEDIFFTELAKAFDNFEKIAEKLYYGKE